MFNTASAYEWPGLPAFKVVRVDVTAPPLEFVDCLLSLSHQMSDHLREQLSHWSDLYQQAPFAVAMIAASSSSVFWYPANVIVHVPTLKFLTGSPGFISNFLLSLVHIPSAAVLHAGVLLS